MVLIGFSSCDETELIDPQDQRTTLNSGAGSNATYDDGNTSVDGTYTLSAEETVSEPTTAGGGMFDLDDNMISTDGRILTVEGDNNTAANQTIDPNDDVRSVYDAPNAPLTANPMDAATQGARTHHFSGGKWDHKSPKPTDTNVISTGSTGAGDLTPVMPEDVEATTKRSRMGGTQ